MHLGSQNEILTHILFISRSDIVKQLNTSDGKQNRIWMDLRGESARYKFGLERSWSKKDRKKMLNIKKFMSQRRKNIFKRGVKTAYALEDSDVLLEFHV